jgi:nickel-type superoxide dismutase maturation protease
MRWPLWRIAVAERSMEPGLRPGDWLLVWRGLRPGRPPRVRPGQLVIARHPAGPDLLLVKRAAWREPGGWWLSADNLPAGAADSRTFGVVPPVLIEGRVLFRYRRTPA